MFSTDYSLNIQRLLHSSRASSTTLTDVSDDLTPLARSASACRDTERSDSVSKTVWKYKPLHLRRLTSRSPSLCSTASEADSITESFTSGGVDRQERRSDSVHILPTRNHVRSASVYEDVRSSSVTNKGSTYMMGMRRQPLRASSRPTPGRRDLEGSSAQLSARISEFLQRTDHVMDEWKRLGHREPLDMKAIKRSTSVSNIMIKGFQYWGRESAAKSLCSNSYDVLSENDEVTLTL